MDARAVGIPERVRAMALLDRVDYGDAFAVDCPPEVLARLTSDELGELAMGHAPRGLRALVRFVQGRLLGLQLSRSTLHVSLGWQKLHSTERETVYGVAGGLITPRLLVMKEPDRVLVVFLMRQERRWATPIVAVVKPIHRVIARYLLSRGTGLAVARAGPGRPRPADPGPPPDDAGRGGAQPQAFR